MSRSITGMIDRLNASSAQAAVYADTVRQIKLEQVRLAKQLSLPEPKERDIRGLAVRLLAERDGWNCYLCGCVLDVAGAIVEHIIPLSRGGENEPHNAGLACGPCNDRKGSCYVSIDARRRAVYHRK